jgi:hypothetical protein
MPGLSKYFAANLPGGEPPTSGKPDILFVGNRFSAVLEPVGPVLIPKSTRIYWGKILAGIYRARS